MKNNEAALILSQFRHVMSPGERAALKLAILALKHQPALSREAAADLATLEECGLSSGPEILAGVFSTADKNVMMRAECVCRARSHTMAKRIANALNRYPANREGV